MIGGQVQYIQGTGTVRERGEVWGKDVKDRNLVLDSEIGEKEARSQVGAEE